MPEYIPTRTPRDLDAFTQGYLECAEFCDCNPDNPELEAAETFSDEFIAGAKADCADFQESFADELARYEEVTGRDMAHAGHDFWLTRNGHGAGFWDRGNDPVLRELTDAAHAYGSIDLYAGEDGLIYGG